VLPPIDYPAEVLEAEASVVFCLDAELKITYCNPAWDRFARENGGSGLCLPEPIGRRFVECVGGPEREYYERLFQQVLTHSKAWERDFECSSSTMYRKFRQRVVPMPRDRGLLVMNSLCIERPHDRPSCPPLDEVYRNPDGFIVMCSSCRRTRRHIPGEDRWDWVPAFVDSSSVTITHGLCRPCLEMYYGEIGA
jgi:hypothetical protein